MKDKNDPGRALTAYCRPMAPQQRVAMPLTALPRRTVEATVAEKEYGLVCHGSRARAVYQERRDG